MSFPQQCWSVVLFEGDESVEAVPKLWLHDVVFRKDIGKCVGYCKWPSKNVTELSKKGAAPEESWDSFPVKVLGDNYGTYELARYKSIIALDKSDLESSDNNSKVDNNKRKIFSKDLYSPSPIKKRSRDGFVGEEGSDHDQLNDESFDAHESPPPMPTTPTNLINNKELKSAKKCLYTDRLAENKQAFVKTISPAKKQHKHKINKHLSSPKKKTEPVLPLSEFFAWKSQVNKSLATISMQLEALTENVALALEKSPRPNTDDLDDEEQAINDIVKYFPLTTLDDLRKTEEVLKLKSVYDRLVNHFSRIGGNNVKEGTRRALKALMSDEVAQNFSYYGLKNKSPFVRLNLKNVLFDSVKKNYQNSTDAEIETVVKDWLRQAKSRIDIRKKPQTSQEKSGNDNLQPALA